MKKIGIGLDIGIGSVGWAVISLDDQNEPEKIIDLGVRTFDSGEVAKTGDSKNKVRRASRGSRRVIRRRRHRLDRIRQLLDEHNLIDVGSYDNANDYYNEAKNLTNEIINNYYKNKDVNPFLLKVKALDSPLTNDELLIITLHYGKYRGYKSNREDQSEAKSSETGKVLLAIKENEEVLSKYRTVSEMFLKDEKFKNRIRNEPGDYKASISRESMEKEIIDVLNKQIELGTITPNFKDEYIKIWASQRSFAKGPGTGSKYGAADGEELIDRMVGTCKFTNEKRAPKHAPSAEMFIALQNLVNFRYSTDKDQTFLALTKDEIKKIIEVLMTQDKVTYKKIASILDKPSINVKALSLTKNDFKKVINQMKKEFKKDQIFIKDLNEDELIRFNEIKNEIKLNKTFLQLPTYSYFRKNIKKSFSNEVWEDIQNNFELFDEIIRLLTLYKTPDTLNEQLEKSCIIDSKYFDFIHSMPNYNGHIRLSLSLVKSLNELLKDGYRYDEAMSMLNYSHFDLWSNKEKFDYLPGVMIENDITNQRVVRSLTQSRKVINAIIKEYGNPYMINIEVARELARTREEKNEIDRKNKERHEDNIRYKNIMVETFNNYFKRIEDIKGSDLLKYKLWIEQDEYCPYSCTKIDSIDLFNNNLVQIDHILPYSRTGNDSYLNKTLVKTSSNQNKGTKTPYEWLKGSKDYDDFENFILNSQKIPAEKKSNYLLKNLTPEMEEEYKARNLNDTKYISKYLVGFIKTYLNVEKVGAVKGAITSKLRGVWGFNKITHSLESETYYLPDDMDTPNKSRTNHLHHALDAAIVAVTTPTLIKRVTEFEKYKRHFRTKKIATLKDPNSLKNEIINYERETGEIYNEEELESFLKDAIEKDYLNRNRSLNRLTYPVPYKTFTKELKLRLYERDLNYLQNELLSLPNYTTIDDVNLVIPTIAPIKINGTLHKETYYGLREYDNELYLTSRVSVNSASFKQDTIQKIVNKDNSSKEVINTLKDWIRGYDNGDKAFKAKGFPLNPKSNNVIKKVTIKKSTFKNKGHIIGHKKVVEIGNIHKIGVYKRPNSSKLYFVGYDLLTLKKIKSKNTKDLKINVWWGRGKNNETLSYEEFSNKYNTYTILRKNDLVLVELNNGNKGLCYSVGFSGGRFEVNDILGDGKYLTNQNLFRKESDRYHFTISTIKNIEKININILGKIEKQYQLL